MPYLDILVIVSAFIGSILAGLFGGGAGLIFTPTIFLFLHSIDPNANNIMQTSITTMIAALIPSGILTTIKHNKYNHIDWTVFKWSAPIICIGSSLGCFAMTRLPSQIIMYTFSFTTVILALRATYKFFSSDKTNIKKHPESSLAFKYIGSLILGFICTISGAASFVVPFYEKLGLNIKKAIGTTTIVVLCYSIIVLFFMILLGLKENNLPTGNIGFLNYKYLLLFMIPTFPGALLGTKLAQLLPEKKLKFLFIMLMYVIGISMLLKALK